MTIPPTTPPYDPQIPTTETNIPTGQSEFLNNFEKLFGAFGMNHVALNDPTNPGNHSVIELVEQKNKRTTQNQELAIYSKKVEGQTDQLFMRYQSNGKEFQITEYQIYSLSPLDVNGIVFQKRYFSFLPGGLIVYFGETIPFGNPFFISLEPAICSNITGVNLCPIGNLQSGLVQSNVTPIAVNGKFTAIQLTSVSTNANQYYMVFGNI